MPEEILPVRASLQCARMGDMSRLIRAAVQSRAPAARQLYAAQSIMTLTRFVRMRHLVLSPAQILKATVVNATYSTTKGMANRGFVKCR